MSALPPVEGRRFSVRGLLGQGGFGRVYLAELESAGGFRKQVAIKVLDDQSPGAEDAARRLRDEARLLGLLRHQNIVAVDDLIRFDEGWGVVMEVVPGVDLGVLVTHLVHRGGLPARATAQLGLAVARALDAAWSHAPEGTPLQVIHRDIKPPNIRITPSGDVKVLDFGIARADFDAREATTTDQRYGSLAYMSPERVIGDPGTSAGDAYALGVVLWEARVARVRGRAKLRPEDHAEQVAEMVAAVPEPALGQLIARLCAYEPEARPTVGDTALQLRQLAATLPGDELETVAQRYVPQLMVAPSPTQVTALVPSGSSTTVDLATLAQDAPPLAPATPAPPRAPWVLAGAVVAGLLTVVGAGAGVWMTKSSPSPAPAADNAPAVVVSELPAPAPEPSPTAAPEPTAAPDPAPEAEPAPPAKPAPQAKAATTAKPAKTPAATPPPRPDPEPTAPADGPRLRAVKFTAAGAERVSARCGDVSGSGATSALVRDLPAGSCQVTATLGGQTLSTTVAVDAPRGFACTATAGSLSCR